MKIEKHPTFGIWVREDGALCMPPRYTKFKKFHWSFGYFSNGYRVISIKNKRYYIHRIVAETFLGAPPKEKPEIDHIDRDRGNNEIRNLRWVSHKENETNKKSVDDSLAKYGVRNCEDSAAYQKAYRKRIKSLKDI